MPEWSMNAKGPSRFDEVTAFRNVPEHHDPVEPTFGPQLKPGHLLDGRFLIGDPLSRSGMATIYKAEDTQNQNQPVAVKVPHLQYEADPAFHSRFVREEEIGRKLDHPYLLKFVPVEKKSRPYLVTEYLAGCTLSHLMDAMRPLAEKDALKIASLICDALQHMHWRGVVHRDLKPGNIMICRDRTIRLMDFGIATAEGTRRITMVGIHSTMGTPDYMAPEQVSNKQTDDRTDIYSLGVILYEMLTGVVPFRNDNPWISMNNRVTGDPVAPRKLNPAISPQAEEIVLHAMQREPGNRYQTAAKMKVELDAPEKVQVTGLCDRLQPPHWKFGFRTTPVLFGAALGVGFIAFQVLLFFVIRHFLAK